MLMDSYTDLTARFMDNPRLIAAWGDQSQLQRVGDVLGLHRRAQLPGNDV